MNHETNTRPTAAKSSPQTSTAAGLPAATGVPNDSRTEVVFRFDAPSAHEVWLAADFTGWDQSPVRMIKGGGGVWHTKVELAQGRHLYKFLVDGEWQHDPENKHRAPNAFGTFDNVKEVAAHNH